MLVSLAYHSFMMFRNGVKSLSVGLALSTLSPAFMRLAATKDTDRLFSMLPYKTLSFSKIEGRHGTYALIDKGENRDREIRKPRPSIRAQLKADKAKTAPKKAAAKTKNHDMEV